jgi:molybdenum cofactor cytidylyltransferase
MGAQKLLLPVAGRPLFTRALDAAAAFPCILVASLEVAAHAGAEPGLEIVLNERPERGMTHSLALANAAIGDPEAALVVLLADTPLVDAALIARVVAACGDADVAYPVRGGVPGHPVVFGPRARARIAGLPDGDTLRALRDDPGLRRVEVPETEDRAFADVDTPEDFTRLRSALEPSAPEPGS